MQKKTKIETINASYEKLISLGFKPSKIASQAQILSIPSDILERNFNFLQNTLKIKSSQIISYVQLLSRSPKTIRKNWQNLRRYLDDSTIRNNIDLFEYSPYTINANVQFLTSYGIDIKKHVLYVFSPQLKRRKIAWIARNVFNANILDEYERREVISKVRQFVSKYPRLTLYPSIKILEKKINKLKNLASKF